MKNLKCKFWLYTAKKNKGASPLHFRILVNGKKVETSLGIQLKDNEWDDKKEKIKNTNPHHKSLNTRLETIEAAFHKAIEQLIDIGDTLTPVAVKNLVFPKVSIENEKKLKVSTLKQLTTEFLQSIKRSNLHTDGTYKRYRTMCLRFSEYIHNTLGMHDIDLASLRFTHLQGYENEISNRYDVNTVVRYVKGVKMLINYGIKEGYLEFNPFIKHKSRKTVTKPILYLTEEEVSKLEQKDFDNQRLDEVRDFFLLQCYSGMSFADLTNFRKTDVKEIEGRYFVAKRRQKTGIVFNVPLTRKAQAIMEKYKWKLPVKSNQKMNCYLKEIASICGLTMELTTHVGRKTFATMALTKGVPIDTVSRMVGHSNTQMTLSAYAEILPKKMIDDMKILEGLD